MNGLLGIVLAGGLGRRLGGRKAAVEVGGLPLVVRALRALAPSVEALGVVGSDDGVPAGVPVRPDLRSGEGPLAGLETALAWARDEGREGVLLLACDLPLVTGALTAGLAACWRTRPDRRSSAVIAGTGADRQPLCGVYGIDLAAGLSDHLDRASDRSVHGWVDGLAARVEVSVEQLGPAAGDPPGAALLNLNTPADRARAELLVDDVPPVVAVVGWKDSGKTTVAVALVAALRERGLGVVALKHGHGFRLDTPGTDSWRLRHEGGAERVILAGPDGHATFGAWGPGGEPDLAELVRRWGRGADVAVAEGWKDAPVPAIEVRGAGERGPPVGRAGSTLLAVVCPADHAGPRDAAGDPPALSRDDPRLAARLADLVLRRVLPDRAPALSRDP